MQIVETATIVRFVVMFASGDGLAVLFAASSATDWAFAMFGIGPTGLSKTARRAPQPQPPLSIPGRANLSISVDLSACLGRRSQSLQMDDPVITPTLLRDYRDRFSDYQLVTFEPLAGTEKAALGSRRKPPLTWAYSTSG
jgi:hypothetical protein